MAAPAPASLASTDATEADTAWHAREFGAAARALLRQRAQPPVRAGLAADLALAEYCASGGADAASLRAALDAAGAPGVEGALNRALAALGDGGMPPEAPADALEGICAAAARLRPEVAATAVTARAVTALHARERSVVAAAARAARALRADACTAGTIPPALCAQATLWDAHLALDCGDLEAVRCALSEGGDTGAEPDADLANGARKLLSARASLVQGDADGALSTVDEVAAHAAARCRDEAASFAPLLRVAALGAGACALASTGRHAAAAARARFALSLCGRAEASAARAAAALGAAVPPPLLTRAALSHTLGLCLLRLGDTSGAAPCLEYALGASTRMAGAPRPDTLLLLAQCDVAAHCERCVDADTRDRTDEATRGGCLAVAERRLQACVFAVEAEQHREPEGSSSVPSLCRTREEALLWLAFVRLEQEHAGGALAAVSSALAPSPSLRARAIGACYTAEAHCARGDPVAALSALRDAQAAVVARAKAEATVEATAEVLPAPEAARLAHALARVSRHGDGAHAGVGGSLAVGALARELAAIRRSTATPQRAP